MLSLGELPPNSLWSPKFRGSCLPNAGFHVLVLRIPDWQSIRRCSPYRTGPAIRPRTDSPGHDARRFHAALAARSARSERGTPCSAVCRACPRLVHLARGCWLIENGERSPTSPYWGRPVPGLGIASAAAIHRRVGRRQRTAPNRNRRCFTWRPVLCPLYSGGPLWGYRAGLVNNRSRRRPPPPADRVADQAVFRRSPHRYGARSANAPDPANGHLWPGLKPMEVGSDHVRVGVPWVGSAGRSRCDCLASADLRGVPSRGSAMASWPSYRRFAFAGVPPP